MNVKVLNIEVIPKNYKIHLIDNESYKYCVTYDVLRTSVRRKSKLHRFFRNNIYTKENIKNYLLLNDINIILKSNEVINATDFLEWNCPLHGNFQMNWNCIKNGQSCPKCGYIKSANSKRNSYEYVKSKFYEKGLLLISSEYVNNEEHLEYICLNHRDNGIQRMSFANLQSCEGCPTCGKENMIKKQSKTHSQFLKEVKLIHGDKYIVKSKYVNCKEHVKVYCTECDMEFPITPNHLLEGHGCPFCNISRGEEYIKTLLINYNIIFTQQYTFENCRNKRKLPFDFAIFKDNNLSCLIEYQGIQHYKSVELFGGEKQLLIQQDIDNIKRKYCIDNNIKLIEIPYFEYKNIEQILVKEKIILQQGGNT
jgi:hypothetical protein